MPRKKGGRLPSKKAVPVGMKNGEVAKAFPFSSIPIHPPHRGGAVRVGLFTVLAGGTNDLQPEDLRKADILIPLTDKLPRTSLGQPLPIIAAPLRDYGGVPDGWERFLRTVVIPLLADGKRVLAYCMGSHGRTGTFLASLIALLESERETPDPIAAVRQRHCCRAVESLAQAEAIFNLRGQPLPEKYRQEFFRPARGIGLGVEYFELGRDLGGIGDEKFR